MLRVALLCCAVTLTTSAFAQPTLGPLLEVKPGNEVEFVPFYSFGTGVLANPETYVLTWQDDRSTFSQLYGAIITSDGGVVVPGVRLLLTHADLPDIGGAAGCRRAGSLYFLVTSSSQQTGVLLTDTALRRQRFSRITNYAVATTAVECTPAPVLWAFAETTYPAGPVAHFALRVNGLDADGGTFELDGGAPLVADLNVVDAERVGPSIASDGIRSLVVWAANADGGADGLDVFGAFVSGSDVLPPFLISGGAGDQANPRLGWNGGASFFVAWEEGLAPVRDLNLARVSTTGTVLSAGFLANTSEDEYAPVLRRDSASLLLAAWLSGAPKPNQLWLGPAPTSAQPPILLRDDFVDEVHLASVRDGQVFVQYRDFTRSIHTVGQLVNRFDAGAVIDPLYARRAQLAPTLVNAGRGPLALWTENGTQLLTRLGGDAGVVDLGSSELPRRLGGSTHGVMLLTPGITFSQGVKLDPVSLAPLGTPATFANTPAVLAGNPISAAGGFTFATAADDGGARAVSLDQLLDDGGVGAHLVLAPAEPEVFNLDVAFASATDVTLVAWNEHRLVHAKCVRGFGTPTPTVTLRTDVGTGHYEPRPRVATSGEGFLVVWVSERSASPYTPLIVAQRVDSNCQLDGPQLELGEAVEPWHSGPQVVFDGLQYVVVWVTDTDPLGDLVGVRVQRDLSVTGPFPVVTQNDSDVEPTFVPLAPGHWAVGFTHFFADEASSSRRLFARFIDDRRNGTTCTDGAQCESGVCAEGVCCNRACATGADQCETCAPSGQCRPRTAGVVCRPSGAACDTEETCDGTNASCPPDTSGMTCTLCDGTPALFALQCGVPFTLPASAIPIPDGGAPIVYGVRSCDATALPSGLSVEPDSGVLTWTPPQEMGTTRVLVVGQGPNASATQVVQLDLSCTVDAGVDAGVGDGGAQLDAGLERDGGAGASERRLSVGCGCDATSGLLVALTLLWLARRRPLVV